MSLTTIIKNRQQALLNDWKRDPLILVIVEGMAELKGVVTMLEVEDADDATINRVGTRNETNVAILRTPGNPDSNASVWVKASYRSYRSAYLGFIKEVYGVTATSADLSGFDADHLMNKARSPNGSQFIRLEAVSSAANQGWGRTFEKAAGFDAQRARRTMDFTIAAKVAGLLPPVNKQDTRQIDRIVEYFEKQMGLPRHEAEGFRSRMDFGYSQR